MVLGEGFGGDALAQRGENNNPGAVRLMARPCNYRIGADDASRVLCDVVLPSGRLEGASVYGTKMKKSSDAR